MDKPSAAPSPPLPSSPEAFRFLLFGSSLATAFSTRMDVAKSSSVIPELLSCGTKAVCTARSLWIESVIFHLCTKWPAAVQYIGIVDFRFHPPTPPMNAMSRCMLVFYSAWRCAA
mmetsp:Transcript_19720/g.46282  ORF Transcript_19720/g.46282 Transcript_19720/m.46282 type:complete len:115 (+) Transcript_19720:1608-1952(+)